MKRTSPKKLPQYRKRTKADVGPEVLVRLKRARLSAGISLQSAGTKLGISMSTMWAMEEGRCPVSQEQTQALFQYYLESVCAIAEDVAAMAGS